MPRLLLAAMLGLAMMPVHAQKKSCDELKAQIEEKVKSKGVKAFSVEIVANADVKGAKVVGSCDGGAKKIVYKKD